ncbi:MULTISPECIES: GNAT family N-acetyltransferase [Alloalcanivorax]|uniref:Phosphinothricin acetyltransferase n=2 Tax=Alloalcanivorax TaxID=3020832 RepID=A0ABT2R009_9GAMM|nr:MULTISPECIES: GNAT family N-acetyltransferase [Alloalcanivorax]MCU5783123.1 phosphinothricin acetyltransferase [Alloalcanivorax balearicus MACL04]WOA31841.1 GNAT family N-acetyltransferase [Alloalcanivorax xenomutans]
MPETVIRDARPADAEAMASLYNHYVRESIATFETEPVAAVEMARRIQKVKASSLPWRVAETTGGLSGYAYATRWHDRHAYRFSVESTVYIDAGVVGQGLGERLYLSLLSQLRHQGLHAVMAVIALPNAASVALHEKVGFRQSGCLRAVGRKFERWIDVGYWQCFLTDVPEP